MHQCCQNKYHTYNTAIIPPLEHHLSNEISELELTLCKTNLYVLCRIEHTRLGAFVLFVKASLPGNICFFFVAITVNVWNDACFHHSEASTQKQRSLKYPAGSGQRATVQPVGITERTKKGPRARQVTPDKNFKDTQQETYRVCRLLWAFHCSLNIPKLFKI